MRYNLLCFVALATATLADDYVLTTLNNIRQVNGDVSQGIRDWDGSYTGAMAVISQCRGVVKIATALFPPSEPTPPTDEILQKRMESAQSLATEHSACIVSTIAAKSKVEAIYTLKTGFVIPTIRSMRYAFSVFGKAFIARTPSEQQDKVQAIFDQIDSEFDRAYIAYQS